MLPLLKSDLLDIMTAVSVGKLAEVKVKFSDKHACCVILASNGYPASYESGFEISIPDEVLPSVYIAGAREQDGKLYTAGGRVLGVTATGETLKDAIDGAYEKAEKITFSNKYCRSDIGAHALRAKEN